MIWRGRQGSKLIPRIHVLKSRRIARLNESNTIPVQVQQGVEPAVELVHDLAKRGREDERMTPPAVARGDDDLGRLSPIRLHT